MNKVIVYENLQGGISVVHPAPQDRREIPVDNNVSRMESDDEFLARVASVAVPPNTKFYIVDSDKIPADRVLRKAWRIDRGKVVEDDEAAVLAVREERGNALQYLNDLLAKTIAQGGDVNAITAKLQQVDDILPQIDAARTAAEVKVIMSTLKEVRSA